MISNTKYQILNTKHKVLLAVFAALIPAFLLVIHVSKTHAQAVIPLVVAPARQSISADPGETTGFGVRFYNTDSNPISGTLKVADFIVSDNQGSPVFLEGPTTLSDRYAAADWVTLNTYKGTISGSGMITVNGTVKVPKNANPGGKYFAVFFEPDAVSVGSGETDEQGSSITMRVAALIYLRVNGAISESANIIKFKAPSFSEYGPVNIVTEIKNNGDYHITPAGQITLKNMFGREIAKVDLPEVNVFPNASRVINSKVGEKWMIGRFTASLNAVYGETGKPLSASLAFWVFPWKLATVILLGIIIIILIVIIITNKFIKKEKKLEAELEKEKEELEKLKETFKDKIGEILPESKEKTSTEK